MKRFFRILSGVALLSATACIENDIPYPVVEVGITAIEGEGFTLSGIDIATKTVTITLDERTDIEQVRIDSVHFDTQTTNPIRVEKQELLDQIVATPALVGRFDMRTPIYATLRLYQDYRWTIRAEQPIERYFTIAGQVGATVFDLKNRHATAYLPKGSDRSAVSVTGLKLGPEGITSYSPTAEQLSGTSFETVRFVDITAHGRTERWVLSVEASANTVSLTGADAWSQVIWLYGAGVQGETMGFRYRQQDAEAWTEVPDVATDGGSFSARLRADAQTTYEVLAYCGDEQSEVQTLTTEAVMQLPNGDMELWSQPKAPWLPYLSDGEGNPVDQYWDTGNKGSTTLGERYNVTTPAEDVHAGSTGTRSAELASRYVALKFAAGNLFVGQYAATRGTNGVVNFGRPFTLRPTAVRVWVKYAGGAITDVGSVPPGTSLSVGDPDNGAIYIALGTWSKERYGLGLNDELFGTDASPVSIDTRKATSFFNPRGEDVIAYGERAFVEPIDTWTQVTIPITYRATDERPTHLILVCSASRWGDYFTGSRDSKLWVDEVELVYE